MINHLALIMDGNRRWAKKRLLKPWIGHKQGTQTVKAVIEYCLKKSIKHLSLYTFSLENFKRSQLEQKYLFDLIVSYSEEFLSQLINQNIKVLFIGMRSLFPQSTQQTCSSIEEKTQSGTALTVYILFGYGGKQEVVEAVKLIAQEAAKNKIDYKALTENTLKSYLLTQALPDVDLVIRTGGHKRLSNFLPFQTAYSELYFTDTLWPDLTISEVDQAIEQFYQEQRNFGA